MLAVARHVSAGDDRQQQFLAELRGHRPHPMSARGVRLSLEDSRRGFRVLGKKPGVLRPRPPRTGASVERSAHVALEEIEIVHIDWPCEAHLPGVAVSAEQARTMYLTPLDIAPVLVDLKPKLATFHVRHPVRPDDGRHFLRGIRLGTDADSAGGGASATEPDWRALPP